MNLAQICKQIEASGKHVTASGRNLLLQNTKCRYGYDFVYYLCRVKEDKNQSVRVLAACRECRMEWERGR